MKEELTLGPLEKEILEIVWKLDCPTVRCVLFELNAKRKKSEKLAYTTVMTIMKRLVDKQVLSRHKEGRSYQYQAQKAKPLFIKQVVKQTIQNVVDRFGEPAMAAFVDEVDQLSKQEKETLLQQLHS